MEPKLLTVDELLAWLAIDIAQLKTLRRRRDGTKFPPPALEHGLVWHEQDVVEWIAFLADWQDAGMTAEALEEIETPTYRATEPELKEHQPR